jgi:hypothetical protein
MDVRRVYIAAGVLAIGLLQAWDSHIFEAGATVIVLALAGVAAPPAALVLSGHRRAHVAGVAIGALLLVAARIVSSIPLPALLLASLFAGLGIVACQRLTSGRGSATS